MLFDLKRPLKDGEQRDAHVHHRHRQPRDGNGVGEESAGPRNHQSCAWCGADGGTRRRLCAGKGDEGEAGRPLPNPDASAELPILPIGGDFTLTDQNGRPFSLSSLDGQAVLIFFGYTMCPDACPTTLSKLSTATAKLSDAERAARKGALHHDRSGTRYAGRDEGAPELLQR